MLTFLALIRLPEWTALSKVQRRFVSIHCIHPLLIDRRAMNAKTLLLLAGLAVALSSGVFSLTNTIGAIAVMYALAFLPSELIDIVVVAQHRQLVREFIQSHEAEIATAA